MRATIILLSAAATVASAAFADGTQLFDRIPFGPLEARQAFNPGETTGRGSTCVEAFGAGSVECVPKGPTRPRPLCYNPGAGQTCCDNLWGCPSRSFCLVQDLCCPTGLDPKTCANRFSVTLPADFGVSKTSTTTKPTSTPSSSSPSAYTDDPTVSATESEPAASSTADYDSTTTPYSFTVTSSNTVISYPSTTTYPGSGANYSTTSKSPSSTSAPPIQTAGAVQEQVAFAAALVGFAAAFVL